MAVSDILNGLARVSVFGAGAAIVIGTILSATRTFVLPRSANTPLTYWVFRISRWFFDLRLRRAKTYGERDRTLAMYAPLTLLALPPVWLALVLLGYTGMFWAIGVDSLYEAFIDSGSSLLTLGFASIDSLPKALLAFSEAVIGLILVALLIAYLPTMYSAFSRRESLVAMLEVRADNPPSAAAMLERYHRIHGLNRLNDLWAMWEVWFAEVEESHTSLAALVFFRSPQPDRSWVTASGAVLDAAALTASTLDVPRNPQVDLCLRAGYVALRRIADFFRISYNAHPVRGDPISIAREEFDAVYDRLARSGIALKPDRDQCWLDFAGWRVNYDAVLLALAGLTAAPYAPWSSDRSLRARPVASPR